MVTRREREQQLEAYELPGFQAGMVRAELERIVLFSEQIRQAACDADARIQAWQQAEATRTGYPFRRK